MAIDFCFPPEVEDVRKRVRAFMEAEVKPAETEDLWAEHNRRKLVEIIQANGVRLNNIAADLLTLSEIEDGRPGAGARPGQALHPEAGADAESGDSAV